MKMKTQHTESYAAIVLRRKFKAINAYIKKLERSPINNLTGQLKDKVKRRTH